MKTTDGDDWRASILGSLRGGRTVGRHLPLAIALGAALGGLVLDTSGVQTVFLAGGIAVVVGGGLLGSTRRGLSR
jgi:predicted MFS family arabinose efflux permease